MLFAFAITLGLVVGALVGFVCGFIVGATERGAMLNDDDDLRGAE